MIADHEVIGPAGARRSRRSRGASIFLYAVVFGGAIVVAFPFLWMLLTAFKTVQESNAYPPDILPNDWRWSSFREAWNTPPSTLGRYLFNSALIATVGTALQLAFCILAAFAFARLRFRGRDALFLVVLSTTMVPGEVTLIPNFVTIRHFPFAGGNDLGGNGGSGLYDTYAGIILPGLAGAFTIFLLRQAFMQIPNDLWEAAQIDGSHSLRFLFGVMLPLSLPAILTVAIFAFVARWNALLWPLIVTRSESLRPVQLAMTFYQSEFQTDHGLVMAASVIVTLPIVLLYIAVQKQFITGVANTGLKG